MKDFHDLRSEALHQAVNARAGDEDPETTVERAKTFYDFLNGDDLSPPADDDRAE